MNNLEDIILLIHSLNKNACKNLLKNLKEGNIKRVDDDLLQQPVIEINGEDFQRNYIIIDKTANKKQNIINYLNLHLRNIHKRFQITIFYKDNKDIDREIIMSTHLICCKLTGNRAQVPLRLEKDWNFLQIDLQNLSYKIFQTQFKELNKIYLHSNCRITCIYLSSKQYKQRKIDFSKIVLNDLINKI